MAILRDAVMSDAYTKVLQVIKTHTKSLGSQMSLIFHHIELVYLWNIGTSNRGSYPSGLVSQITDALIS